MVVVVVVVVLCIDGCKHATSEQGSLSQQQQEHLGKAGALEHRPPRDLSNIVIQKYL